MAFLLREGLFPVDAELAPQGLGHMSGHELGDIIVKMSQLTNPGAAYERSEEHTSELQSLS